MGLNSVGRLARLRQKLAERGLDGAFISSAANRFYLSGFSGSAGYLFISARDAVLATDFRYVEQAKIEAPGYDVAQIGGKVEEWFPKLSGQLEVKRLAFESEQITVAFHRQLTDALAKKEMKLELVPSEGLVESLRLVKEPEEIAFILEAARITDDAMAHIAKHLHAGMTEKDAAWEIEAFMREHGSQPVAFEVIVQSGPNSALPHARPSERQINHREPVVIDIGAKVGSYASDLTRTLCLGTPDDTFRKIYDIVLAAQLTALAMIKEGMTGETADSLARTVIAEAGYADAFGHSLGHGVGLDVHEAPRLGPSSTDVLAAGMVFSVEPGIYVPGWGGVRTEDLVTLEPQGLRILSRAPKIWE